MRTANFRDDLLHAIAASLSINPSPDLSPEFAAQWISFINTRLAYAWFFYDWPDLTVTQERAFRPIWRADQDYFANDEVYFLPTPGYYKAIQDVTKGTPPTDTNFWAALSAVDKFVEYDQFGQQPIGQVRGVFPFNPRVYPSLQPPGLMFRPSEKGIDVLPFTGNSVFLNYQIVPSRFTSIPWQAGVAYSYGNVVYWSDGNCYQCGVASTTSDPTDISSWFVVPLPQVLLEYVKAAVAADASDDRFVEQQLLQEAQGYLEQEVNKLMSQGHVHRYNLRQPQRTGIPYGVSGFWWSASAPWSGGFVSTLTDQLYSPLAQDRRETLATETGQEIVTETGQEILAPN
jgi:hypothetical protein